MIPPEQPPPVLHDKLYERLEALTPRLQPALENLLSKAGLAVLSILAAAVAWALGDTWPVRILLGTSTLQLVLLAVLYVRVILAEGRLRHTKQMPLSQRQDSQPALNETARTALCLLQDSDPKDVTAEELLKGMPPMSLIELRAALDDLVRASLVDPPKHVDMTVAECITMGYVPRFGFRITEAGFRYLRENGLR